ncbi:hypothetical protein M3Y99_01558700 [Aphelenchoides fujianensis]|nr:hypothetical protein M3Y99_01558700 [Aphelenchoides fujianensis]
MLKKPKADGRTAKKRAASRPKKPPVLVPPPEPPADISLHPSPCERPKRVRRQPERFSAAIAALPQHLSRSRVLVDVHNTPVRRDEEAGGSGGIEGTPPIVAVVIDSFRPSDDEDAPPPPVPPSDSSGEEEENEEAPKERRQMATKSLRKAKPRVFRPSFHPMPSDGFPSDDSPSRRCRLCNSTQFEGVLCLCSPFVLSSDTDSCLY